MVRLLLIFAFFNVWAVDCQLIVTGFTSSSIAGIDLATETGVTVAAGAGPLGIAISKDQQSAYVVNNSGDTVFIYSLATTTPVMTGMIMLPAAVGPQTITVSPSGRYGYIPFQATNEVGVVDFQTQTYVGSVALGAATVVAYSAVGPDGKLYIVGNGSQTLSQLLLTGLGSESVPFFNGNYTLAGMTPGDLTFVGNTAYILNQSTPDISYIDLSIPPPAMSTLIPIAGSMALRGIGYANGFVYVTDNTLNVLWVVDEATKTASMTSYSLPGTGAHIMIISSDQSTAYIANIGSDNITVVDVSSTAGVPVPRLTPISLPMGTAFPFFMGLTSCAANEVTGSAHSNRFFWQTDLYNSLSWTASGSSTVKYNIYRNGILVGETPSSVLTYEDHYLKSKTQYTYSIYAVDSGGSATLVGTVNITSGKG